MLLVKPTLTCNLACEYCYENNWRQRTHPKMDYDMKALLKVIEAAPDKQQISLHGGEPLMLPRRDVEQLFAAMFKKTGKSSVQTNGMAIDGKYIETFLRYKTSVGLSFDGTGELNRYRTDEARTAKLFDTLLEMHHRGINISVISVVSKANAETDELVGKFEQFISTLGALKIGGRINPCVDESACALSEERMIEVYKRLAYFTISHGWKWSPFIDMWNGIRGSRNVVCVFRECDIFHTPSAEVVLGDGSITNCMRVSSKDMYLRHPSEYATRGDILSQVDQVHGGCKDCEFWESCAGGCPTQAIDNDWRNRSILCPMYKQVFRLYRSIQSFGMGEENQKKGGQQKVGSQPAGSHTDGIEHVDGDTQHLDSDIGNDHTDGIEHLDGDNRHLDSGRG